ncbi:MAG: NAD(P)H-hydrate dehydratase [Rhizobacter sp.]|nr:NAD(P)H-hydrate dehydratase [Rhizobacter sp.]
MSDIERLGSAVASVALFGGAATRRIEGAALAGVAPFTLMARAGDAVARLALAVAPHAERTVVFAGPGNNGGDGIEAATRLAALGKRALVVRAGARTTLPTDAAHALQRAKSARIDIRDWASIGDVRADLVIDGLLGIGATRAPEGDIAAAIGSIAELAANGAHVLAIDVPSGLDVDRGQPIGASCVVAHDTLTLMAAKPGLFTGSGRDHAGRVWCAPIGVEAGDTEPDARLVGMRDGSCMAERRRHAAHKGSFGDVVVVGGAPGMEGAAWLAARAAHAAGAGRVFVDIVRSVHAGEHDGAPRATLDPVRPELMARPGWSDGDAAVVAAATVVCGCGGGDAVRAPLPRLLSLATRLVVDADALNAIAADASLLALVAARAARGLATILTPHPLEAARLLGSTTAAVQSDRVAAGRELAARFRAVVVLKGSGTIVAAPGKVPRINATGNASLASAGTGDVLAGWMGGRWATADERIAPLDVATRAVIEHGAAAEPERSGAVRAADLIETMHLRSRGG